MLACNQNPNTRPGKVRVIPLDDLLVHLAVLETGIIKRALGAMAPGIEVLRGYLRSCLSRHTSQEDDYEV